jgi:hypothetical protein
MKGENNKGDKRVRNGKKKVCVLAFPLTHLSLFIPSISLSKGILGQGVEYRYWVKKEL